MLAVTFGDKIRNPWEYSESPQIQVWEFQYLKKLKFKFSEHFLDHHKKHHISKTKMIWAVIFGEKRQLLGVPRQTLTIEIGTSNLANFFISKFFELEKKT